MVERTRSSTPKKPSKKRASVKKNEEESSDDKSPMISPFEESVDPFENDIDDEDIDEMKPGQTKPTPSPVRGLVHLYY